MSDMNAAQLRRLDMSLLLTFAAILRRRKLSAAARELGVTQSAISHALTRLRAVFGDELFLRRQTGVEPTARALALEPEIERIIALASDALRVGRSFDPASDRRTVRIGAQEYGIAVFAGPINRMMQKDAPHMQMSLSAYGRHELIERIADNSLDLAIGYAQEGYGDLLRDDLYEETYAVVARRRHPEIGARLTRAAYLRCEHVLVTNVQQRGAGILESLFARHGAERRIMTVMPGYLSALAAIAHTDRVLTAPRRLAERYAASFGLQTYKLPFPEPRLTVSTLHHRRSARDPAIAWFRERLKQIAGVLG